MVKAEWRCASCKGSVSDGGATDVACAFRSIDSFPVEKHGFVTPDVPVPLTIQFVVNFAPAVTVPMFTVLRELVTDEVQ